MLVLLLAAVVEIRPRLDALTSDIAGEKEPFRVTKLPALREKSRKGSILSVRDGTANHFPELDMRLPHLPPRKSPLPIESEPDRGLRNSPEPDGVGYLVVAVLFEACSMDRGPFRIQLGGGHLRGMRDDVDVYLQGGAAQGLMHQLLPYMDSVPKIEHRGGL